MKLLKIWKDKPDDPHSHTNLTVEFPEISFWGFVTRPKAVKTFSGTHIFRDVESGETNLSDTLENWVWLYKNNEDFKEKWDKFNN